MGPPDLNARSPRRHRRRSVPAHHRTMFRRLVVVHARVGSGATVLTTGAALVAADLQRYGEPATAAWVLTCTDEELVRICTVADWLLHHGPGPASGASMMIARACALAAVYVHEGGPRDLARSRRGPGTGTAPDSGWRRPDPQAARHGPRRLRRGCRRPCVLGTEGQAGRRRPGPVNPARGTESPPEPGPDAQASWAGGRARAKAFDQASGRRARGVRLRWPGDPPGCARPRSVATCRAG